MRQIGPEVVVSVTGAYSVRIRTEAPPTAHTAVGDLVAVGWDRHRDGIHVQHPRFEYLVYDPVLEDLAWFHANEVHGIHRRDGGDVTP